MDDDSASRGLRRKSHRILSRGAYRWLFAAEVSLTPVGNTKTVTEWLGLAHAIQFEYETAFYTT